MKMKLVIAILCLALTATVLCACVPNKTPTALTDTNDVYALGAVSTVRLLGSEMSTKAITSLSSMSKTADDAEVTTTSESEIKKQAQKFNEYFTALDIFLGEEIVTTVSEKNTDTQYPYETKLTINSKNFNGEDVQNVMYFTETLASNKTEVDDDDDDDKDETKSVYTLEGVMIVDGSECRLEGRRTVEQEDDETENELKIRAYADELDKTSYVEMEQEHSVENNENETEYVYSVYLHGVLVEQTAIDFETEKKGEKEEVEYEMEFRKGDAKGKYVVERETKDGKTQMKVEYDIDGKQGQFKILMTADNKYFYEFSDGTSLSF